MAYISVRVTDTHGKEQDMTQFDQETSRRAQKAMEDSFIQLDAIVPEGAVSTDWLRFVDGITGESEGYAEWIAEAWEPLDGYQAASLAGGEPPKPAIFKQ